MAVTHKSYGIPMTATAFRTWGLVLCECLRSIPPQRTKRRWDHFANSDQPCKDCRRKAPLKWRRKWGMGA